MRPIPSGNRPTTDRTDEIDAWIVRPAGFDEFQMQAAAGFVVVCSNPRGSSGRDESWGQAIQGPNHPTVPGPGWGTVDVDDAISFEWSSDIATACSSEHGGTHLQFPDAYERISPIRAVDAIDTSMLIIHSEEDWRCPISQAEELWTALRLLGKEVDYYRFPGEHHELSRSGSPIHRVQRAEIILDWFSDKLS